MGGLFMEKSVKENLNEMKFKEKLPYIWEYYKIHILGSLFFIAIAFSLIYVIFINPPPKTYVGIAFYGDNINDDILSKLSISYTQQLVPEDENRSIIFHKFFSVDSDPMAEVESTQKFDTLFIAQELDLVIANEEYFNFLMNSGYLKSIDSIIDENDLNIDKDLCIFKTDEDSKKEKLYGISLNDKDFKANIVNISDKTEYLGVFNNTERLEESKQVILEILK